nr:MAG TPA: hypothetical protein [Caudoviricetes sp.]
MPKIKIFKHFLYLLSFFVLLLYYIYKQKSSIFIYFFVKNFFT